MKKVQLEIIAGTQELPTGKKVTIKRGAQAGHLHFNVTFKTYREIGVESVTWVQKDTRSGGKAALGAVAGTLTLGPLAGIIGAAIGGRKRDASQACIQLSEGGQIVVACTATEFEALQGYLQP